MSVKVQIPDLKVMTLNNDLKLIFPEEFAMLFCEAEEKISHEFREKLSSLLDQLATKSFRRQIVWKTVPFLLTYSEETHTYRVASAKANRELALINSLETEKELLADTGVNDRFIKLQEHLEKMLSLKVENFPSVVEWSSKENDLVWFDGNPLYEELVSEENVLAKELLEKTMAYDSSLFEKFSDFGLNLTAGFALIRVHLLKFLAILPSLDHDKDGDEVKRLLLETFRRLTDDSMKAKLKKLKGQQAPLPPVYFYLFKFLHFTSSFIPKGILAKLVRYKVRLLAKRFIAGESIKNATQCLKLLSSTKRDATLDQLGELVVSESEADHYMDKVLELIHGLSSHVKPGEKNKAGILKAHVSIKVTALASDFNPQDFDYSYKMVAPRLEKILMAALRHEVFINVDAEHYQTRNLVFRILKKVLTDFSELRDFENVGIVVQAYLRDAGEHLQEILDFAKERKITMPLRLVKGAYWDAETIEADVEGHNAPQFINKEESDLHFRKLMFMIFEASPHVQLCVASHNLNDHCFAQALKKRYPQALEVEHQCLHMTYEGLSTALTKMGWTVRNYVPIGSLLVGMAYLVRRIMENSSQVGILTMMRNHKTLGLPDDPLKVHHKKLENGHLDYDKTIDQLSSLFYNVAPVRLYMDNDLASYQQAIVQFQEKELGQKIKQQLNLNEGTQNIFSPSNPELCVGQIEFADASDANNVIDKANEAFLKTEWADVSVHVRSSVLNKAAELMLLERLNLAVHIQYESGKTAFEALADVDEAIDFLRYYAREEQKLLALSPNLTARGVMAVITPWNFPLAIPTGMVCASLVAGNTVIVKSAEQTPLIVEKLVHLLWKSGVPKENLIHLPGEGETVGKALVESKKIAGVIFTGSKNVGTWISKTAGHRWYEHPKTKMKIQSKVITEMGGKNAIIVTANAELDEVVEGVLYSAFGHAGQKCSAASRVIVHQSVASRLLERLAKACEDIDVGTAFSFSTFINPLISKEDKLRLQNAAIKCHEEVKKHGGKVWVDRSKEELAGHAVGPILVELPYKRALEKDSMAQQEHFGPLLHVISYKNKEEAIKLFNGTEYALTGGLFSQSQDDIDYYLSHLQSGNLYVNRTCTGARVSIEPFGGFKSSGTGPKAGGPHYLRSFHTQKNSSYEKLKDESSFERTKFSKNENISQLARKWNGPQDRLQEHLQSAIVRLLHQYTSIFGKISETDKAALRDLNHFTGNGLTDYIEKNHLNRVIPGQLSYNDYRMIRPQGLYIAYDSIPPIQSLLYLFSALLRGSGVSVLCLSEQIHSKWVEIEKIFTGEEIKTGLFNLQTASEDQMVKLCGGDEIHFIISDGDDHQLEKIHQGLRSSDGELFYKPLLTKFEAPELHNIEKYFEPFTLVRSMAINTMRHGAPLELGI